MLIGIDGRLWYETGVGRYIRNLVTNLQYLESSHEYILFVLPEHAKKIATVVTHKNWKVVSADVHWHSLQEQVRLVKILNSYNLDLVHFPYFSIPIFYAKPYVITIHDLILHHFPTGEASHLPYVLYRAKLEAYKFIIQKAATNAQTVLTVSNATKKEIIDHLHVPDKKVIVTYEGIDPSVTHIGDSKQLLSDPYFLHVGNLYPHKNMDRLLSAYEAMLLKTEKPVKLVIVGKNDFFTDKFKMLVSERKLTKQVVFFDSVTDQELQQFYTHAIATIIPSLMEGFGLPAIEAMSNNCLVLASKIPSLVEVCDDVAVYFDPKHTQSITESMLKALALPVSEKAKKIQSGLAKIQQYSWEDMAKQTVRAYESSSRLRSG